MELETGEKIIKEVRKHWLVFVVAVLFLFVLSIAPIFAYLFVPGILINSLPISISGNGDVLFVFFYTIWMLFMVLIFFFIWTDYYLDVWIITNHRIIDIEQKGFFKRTASSFRLDRIQNITIEVNGFVATMLGYGNIHVETAGESKGFTIPNALHPEDVKQLILSESNRAIKERNSLGGL